MSNKVAGRQLEILKAIVDEYVATQEPVGSKAIADKTSLGISPATIRNEMAALEDEGLITHPHTSAGRIPTDLGYRVFVDKLATVKPMSSAERRAIETFLDQAKILNFVAMTLSPIMFLLPGLKKKKKKNKYKKLKKNTEFLMLYAKNRNSFFYHPIYVERNLMDIIEEKRDEGKAQ